MIRMLLVWADCTLSVYNEELTTCEQGEDLMNHKST